MATREYNAYLLRLWRDNHEATWRALLENPNSGERLTFATLAELVTFLEVKTGEGIRPFPERTTVSKEKNQIKEIKENDHEK